MTGIAAIAAAFKQKKVPIPVKKPKAKLTKNLHKEYPILNLEDLCDIPLNLKKDKNFKKTSKIKICERKK